MRGKRIFPTLILVWGLASATMSMGQDPALSVRSELEKLLAMQSEAWSSGDLETFSSIYADDTVFVSTSGLTRGGPAEIHARYLKRYPDAAAMGKLTLELLEFEAYLGEENCSGDPAPVVAASVVGRWTLTYPEDAERDSATGLTLLLFRPSERGWVIARDASM